MNDITYTTHELAQMFNVHDNTIRFYEEIGFITKPIRKNNGYRIYTQLHLCQCQLIKTALKTELLQNGLRKQVIFIIKYCANNNYSQAKEANQKYKLLLIDEIANAKQAINDAFLLMKNRETEQMFYKRCEVAQILKVTVETLRTWERNGLISIKRKSNGYLKYSTDDVRTLNIIKTLRLANYSLQAILRLLSQKNVQKINENIIEEVLNTPSSNEDIISVCDKLIISLNEAYQDSLKIDDILNKILTLQ